MPDKRPPGQKSSPGHPSWHQIQCRSHLMVVPVYKPVCTVRAGTPVSGQPVLTPVSSQKGIFSQDVTWVSPTEPTLQTCF